MIGLPAPAWFAALFVCLPLVGCVTSEQGGVRTIATDTGAAARAVSTFRASQGLGQVTPNARLNSIAAKQSLAMAERGRLGHDVDGSFARRLKAGGYTLGMAVENIGAGHDSFEQAMASWQRSPGHRRNLLAPGATQIGVAAARSSDRYRTYWTLIMASPAAPGGLSGTGE